jgi:glycosyltransferase involved in cell wall biosynthesis
MYKLSVLAMFKNEGMIIEEWINHYLSEGVEHFYLIDNGSTDDYETKIKKYKSHYTLIKDSTRLPTPGTQAFLYNKHYLDIVRHETQWLIACDIDEYIYARNGYNKITNVLDEQPTHIEQIWLPWKIFWSNGHKMQPKCIVQSFNKHYVKYNKHIGYGKSIIRTSNLIKLDIHEHTIGKSKRLHTSNGQLYNDYLFTNDSVSKLNLHLNHYMLMSEEYYCKVKCVRGGGQSGVFSKYTMNGFYSSDKLYSADSIVDNELIAKKLKI